jgi:adenylate cyclase
MLRIMVQTPDKRFERQHQAGPLEIGRGPRRDAPRLSVDDLYVSRDHLRLEELAGGRLRLENISRKNVVEIEDADPLSVGATATFELPVRVKIGQTSVLVEDAGSSALADLHTIRRPFVVDEADIAPKLHELGRAPSAEVLTQWLERIFAVQRAAAGSAAFYEEAARAVVDLVGLGTACVLLRRGDDWQVVGRYPPGGPGESSFSHTVLGQVIENKRTFYRTFQLPAAAHSLMEIEAVIASPIFNERNEILGVLYGSRAVGLSRALKPNSEDSPISTIEAQVVQLLAAAVGAGLSRMEREAQAARMRIQFEQFFSPELARELERDPSLLEGRERQITVLFTDIRGFSAIAERVGARATFHFMADIMDRLTERIAEFGGVVIDYYGDGIAVMWNAPMDQEDHPSLAARAALALRGELPRLNQSWSARLGAVLDIGIGIHTGAALVGNCGSNRRLKYGPRGHVVNLASRLEQATKQFGAPILLSGETAARLQPDMALRRLCRARMMGISAPVELFQLREASPNAGVTSHDDAFAEAMSRFEAGKLDEAIELLAALSANGHQAAGLLLAQARSAIAHGGARFDGIVDLTTK